MASLVVRSKPGGPACLGIAPRPPLLGPIHVPEPKGSTSESNPVECLFCWTKVSPTEVLFVGEPPEHQNANPFLRAGGAHASVTHSAGGGGGRTYWSPLGGPGGDLDNDFQKAVKMVLPDEGVRKCHHSSGIPQKPKLTILDRISHGDEWSATLSPRPGPPPMACSTEPPSPPPPWNADCKPAAPTFFVCL